MGRIKCFICDNDNLSIIVSVRIDGNGVYELKQVASNFITGMYGRKGIAALIDRAAKDNKILYINNKKSHNIFSLARVQFPYSLNNYDFDTIIHKSSYIVNNKSAESEDIRYQARINAITDAESMTQDNGIASYTEERLEDLYTCLLYTSNLRQQRSQNLKVKNCICIIHKKESVCTQEKI